PFFPRSFPERTTTVSFFLILSPGMTRSPPSQHLRSQRDDLHELLVPQLAGDRAEHAGPDRLLGVVDQDGRVLVEADVGPVLPAERVDLADDDRFHDLPLLHVAVGGGFLHVGRDDVADLGVLALRAAAELDARDLLRARVVRDLQDRPHLDHEKLLVLRWSRPVTRRARRPRPGPAGPRVAPSSASAPTAGATRRSPRC